MGTRKLLLIAVVGLLMFTVSINAFAADRGRILSTQEQQYQNMVLNGSLEAFSAGVNTAPDGYVAEGLNTGTGTVARDATSKFQTYAVKLTQTNAAGTFTLKCDTPMTSFGNSLTGDSADLTTTEWQRLALYSNNGYVASVWVKLPAANAPHSVNLKSASDGKLYVEIDSDATGDYCYIDGFQVTQGPIAPAFVNTALTDSPDTGTQVVYGNIKAQDPASTNYVQMVSTGTLNVGANVSLTSTGTLDLGAGANDDLTAADIADLTDTGATALHTHTGLAPGVHATQHMTGDDKVYWNSLNKANGDATSVTSQITSDIATHAAVAGSHHAVATVSGAGLDISGQQVSLDVAPGSGSATLIEEDDALQVKYNTGHLTEAGTGLELASAYSTGSAYDTRFVNVSGTESMEGPLTIGKTYSSLSGTDIAAQISPVLSQASAGTAGYTALLVKATETAGSMAGYTGTKLLLDLQAGATPASKLTVDNAGTLTTVSNIALSTASATVDGVNLDNALTDLTQGAGITISGGPGGHTRTIANADTGSAQLIFKNITDGTNTAAADTNSDMFTLTSANTMLGIVVNATSDAATFTIVPGNIDHGSIAGLGDNDHPQYPLKASIESITGAWTFSNDLTVNSSAITTDALTVKAESLTTGNLIKGRISLNAQAGANIMKITDTAGTAVDKFIIDRTGAITVGSIPFTSVTSKPTFVNSVTGGGGVTASASTGDITLGTSATVSNTTASYTTGNGYSLVEHMQAIGKGTISADNAHGLRYDDVEAASSGHNHDSVYINDGAGEVNAANDFSFAASTLITNLDSDFLDGQHGAYYLNTSSGAQTKTGNVTFTGDVIMGDNSADTVILASQAATDATVADSPTLYLRGSYDSNTAGGAVTATNYDATIVHNLLTTGPTSEIDFNIAGATKMSLDNSGNLTTLGTINSQTIGATSTFAALNATGELKVGGGYGSTGITMSTDGNLDMDGNLHIAGNLLVDGDQVILNVQTMEVESNKVLMNRNVTGAPVLNAAIEVERGDSPNTVIRWNEAPGYDRWELTNDGTNYLPMAGDITAQYLVNSASDVLTSEIVTSALPQNLTIKGDATSRTITLGKSAGNSDVINLDVSNANLQVRGAQIATTNLSDGANVAHVNAIETITANWVSTDFPWANNEVADDLTINGGTINNTVIGASQAAAATLTNLTATGTLAFPDNSVSMADIDWNAGQILITPDYPNASLYADGSSNNGTLALKNTDDANWRNYYEWTSQVTTLQDYTIVERYVLPPDFSSWSVTNAIKLGFVTQTAVATDNKVDVIVYKSGSATLVYQTLANVSTGWTELVISSANLIGTTWAAGDIVVIKVIVYSKSGNFARTGDITLNYIR